MQNSNVKYEAGEQSNALTTGSACICISVDSHPLPVFLYNPPLVLDVDECVTGLHDCPLRNAGCTNSDGSFICQCDPGFQRLGGICIGEKACRA